MNFLLDLGIKQNTINSIKTKYDEGVIDNFRTEEDNVEDFVPSKVYNGISVFK